MHPLSHPGAQLRVLPAADVRVREKVLRCKVRSVSVDAEFPERGKNVSGTITPCDEIPGGIAQFELKMNMRGRPVELSGQVLEYRKSP